MTGVVQVAPSCQCAGGWSDPLGLVWICVLFVLAMGPASVASGAQPFFVVGDLPYSGHEAEQLASLMAMASGRGTPFILHLGDIKAGGEPCTDARNRQMARLFRRQTVPVLYTPGDNEWTDCHRRSAGGLDPLQRLVALRRAFFDDPAVLRRAELAPRVPDPAFPENLWLRRDGLLLALIHVVGSHNNAGARDARALEERRARDAANRMLLREAVAAARLNPAAAMAVVFHANPLFEQRTPAKGYGPVLADLRAVLEGFPGPLLIIHGDTHGFRLDQPWRDRPGGHRFWRLEVPGSPMVAGVWVSVDVAAEPPFRVELLYPPALDVLGSD